MPFWREVADEPVLDERGAEESNLKNVGQCLADVASYSDRATQFLPEAFAR